LIFSLWKIERISYNRWGWEFLLPFIFLEGVAGALQVFVFSSRWRNGLAILQSLSRYIDVY